MQGIGAGGAERARGAGARPSAAGVGGCRLRARAAALHAAHALQQVRSARTVRVDRMRPRCRRPPPALPHRARTHAL
jgi:hypothetical protein